MTGAAAAGELLLLTPSGAAVPVPALRPPGREDAGRLSRTAARLAVATGRQDRPLGVAGARRVRRHLVRWPRRADDDRVEQPVAPDSWSELVGIAGGEHRYGAMA